jgi:hypothetical protein
LEDAFLEAVFFFVAVAMWFSLLITRTIPNGFLLNKRT